MLFIHREADAAFHFYSKGLTHWSGGLNCPWFMWPQKATVALCLSGTPAVSRPVELYTQVTTTALHITPNSKHAARFLHS